MMSKFNFREEFNKRSVMSYFVPNVMGKRSEEVTSVEGYDPTNIDVKLTVNGVEFDPTETLEWMWKIREEEVRKCATELVEEHLGELINEVHEFAERFRAKIPWSEI